MYLIWKNNDHKLGGYLPLTAEVNIVDSTLEENKYYATQIIDASFDSYTAGEDAHAKPNGNARIEYWHNTYEQNPVFAEDSRGGISVKTTRVENYASFGAIVKPSSAALSALRDENNSRLYLSCDVKVSSKDIVDYVGFWNVANSEQIANFELHRYCGIRIPEANYATPVSVNAFKADTWYNLGVLVDTEKKTVSYYVNGKPVTGAQGIQKSDTFMNTRGMDYLIYEKTQIRNILYGRLIHITITSRHTICRRSKRLLKWARKMHCRQYFAQKTLTETLQERKLHGIITAPMSAVLSRLSV